MAALKAFGSPLSMVWAHTLDTGFAQTAALRRGLVSLGGEFGGGGSVSVDGVRIVERGIRNVLIHVGCMDPKTGAGEPATPTRVMEVRNRDYFVLAPEAGLFEPVMKLGDVVQAGQLCGEVHFVDNPGREPVPAHFRAPGTLVSQRHFGRVERGDCVAHVATDWKG
jgi:predicted deacylase